MPKAFDNCVSKGGRVRTKKLSGGRSQKMCYLDGKTYPGYVEGGSKPKKKKAKK